VIEHDTTQNHYECHRCNGLHYVFYTCILHIMVQPGELVTRIAAVLLRRRPEQPNDLPVEFRSSKFHPVGVRTRFVSLDLLPSLEYSEGHAFGR